jgi:N,N-dimethylformamidase
MEPVSSTSRSILAYCDQLTYRQGDVVDVRAAGRGEVDIDLVRLNRPPDDPDWPVPLVSPVPDVPARRVVTEPHDVYPGSYLLVEGVDVLETSDALTVTLYVWPTLLDSGHPQVLCSTLDAGNTAGFAVVVEEGCVSLQWATSGAGAGQLSSATPLLERQWQVVSASLDQVSGAVGLTHRPARPTPGSWGRGRALGYAEDLRVAGATTVMVGAGQLPGRALAGPLPGSPGVSTGFNGKLECPVLLGAALDIAALDDLDPYGAMDDAVLAAWDFSREQSTTLVVDTAGRGYHGKLVNGPARAVTGVTWKGELPSWSLIPDQYAAVHFHADDLEDALWPVVASLAIPADLQTAVYGIRFREVHTEEEDVVPIIVTPSPGNQGQGDVLIVLPSFTYMAYANLLGKGEEIDYVATGLAAGDALEYPEHQRLTGFEEIGGSCYDVHTDGSARMYSSPRRPLLNCRPNWKSGRRDAYRHLAADLYLMGWLDKLGISYDVVSDHTVHRGGRSVLSPYAVVLTGSHPEYISAPMIDAFETYLDAGGSLFYLGGNGFYWVTTESDRMTELVEVRRGYNGTRTWTSDPGECYHSMTGEIGGLWRYRGRAPNALVGVGMAAQGADGGAAAYKRSQASYDDAVSFLYEGVTSTVIGETGFDMGAAAGDEVDRFDLVIGSPPWGVVVGSSLPLSKYYKRAIEEIQITRENTGGDYDKDVRADLVLIEQASGGFVFSVGSISWIQSMAVGYFTSATARVTENALQAALARSR